MADPEHREAPEEETAEAGGDDEDTGAVVAPIVRLEEVSVTTGEEDEDVLLDQKAKLYRFDKEGNQWKERGGGAVKLLKHKESGKVRLVMRQAKTLKICANHLVLPTISIQEHSGNDKSCVWHASDFADGELKEEFFCMRFASVDNRKHFMDTVEEVAESLSKKVESGEASAAADQLEKLTVVEEKKDVEAAETEKESATKPEEEKASLPAEEKKVEGEAPSSSKD